MASEFYSPIDKDNQAWYNITTRPIQEYLNQNPNAIRSVEGRAAIRNFINSRPYGDMAKLRQSAEVAKKYNELKAKLKAAGKYSDELEASLGVKKLSDWSTLGEDGSAGDGVWDVESPTEMKSLYELTHERFDPLAKLNFDIGPGRNKFYRKKGVTEEHMKPIVETELDGLKNTAYYGLYKSLYGSDDEIKKAIINANKGVLHNSEEADEAEMMKYKESQENARNNARVAAQKAPPEQPYSVTTQIHDDTFAGRGFNNAFDYMYSVAEKANGIIAAKEKKTGKKLSEMEKRRIFADQEYNFQKNAIRTRMQAGESKADAIMHTGTSTAPTRDLIRAVWGESAFSNTNGAVDENEYIDVTPNLKKKLYTKNEVMQLYAKKPYRVKVGKAPFGSISKVKVESVDNMFSVYDAEKNLHRNFVAVTANDGKNYYVEATDNLNPRGAVGQSVDAMQNKYVGQGTKATVNVQGNDK